MFFLFLNGAGLSCAEPVRAAYTEVELMTDTLEAEAGRPFWVGLRMKMDEGWHTYWENPGDAGLATTMVWQVPEDFIVGAMEWPCPQKFDEGGLTTYGYTGETMLSTPITPFINTAKEIFIIKATAQWLACKEICVPGKAELSLTIPVHHAAPNIDPQMEEKFLMARVRVPTEESGLWSFEAYDQGKNFILKILSRDRNPEPLDKLIFFPQRNDLIDHSGEQKVEEIPDGYQLSLPKSAVVPENIKTITGVLVSNAGGGKSGMERAFAVDVPFTKTGENNIKQEK